MLAEDEEDKEVGRSGGDGMCRLVWFLGRIFGVKHVECIVVVQYAKCWIDSLKTALVLEIIDIPYFSLKFP